MSVLYAIVHTALLYPICDARTSGEMLDVRCRMSRVLLDLRDKYNNASEPPRDWLGVERRAAAMQLGLLRFDPYQNRAYNRAYNRAVKYRLGVRVRIKPQQAYMQQLSYCFYPERNISVSASLAAVMAGTVFQA